MLAENPYAHDDDGEQRLRDAARCWNLGRLSYKLDPHQQSVYEAFRGWERDGEGTIFVLDCGRRWGKTFWVDLIKVEDCLRKARSIHTIATAYQKDIGEIIIPVMEEICSDAPAELCPVYKGSSQGQGAGFYFPNGSILRLVGIDVNPKGIRGRFSDGYVITEAAFVKNLAKTAVSKILPQFMRRKGARLILESSAPEDPNHDFDAKFVPDAKRRGAYIFRTIDDNTTMSEEDKLSHYEEAAAISEDDAQREYYGKRIRNREKVILPEFEPPTLDQPYTRHVQPFVRPRYALAMAAMDPGMRDLFAVQWGYWDFDRAKLCIERDYAARNVSTGAVAEMLRDAERELYADAAEQRELPLHVVDPSDFRWIEDSSSEYRIRRKFGLQQPTGLCWWDGKEFRANPVLRVSDTEARLIGDLTNDYQLEVINTLKDDKEAALNALRNAFKNDKIEIHPSCVKTIRHLTSARWNDQRTDYERTEERGHSDLLDSLVYLWRMIQPHRSTNPVPPVFADRAEATVVFQNTAQPASITAEKMRKAFGGQGRSSWR